MFVLITIIFTKELFVDLLDNDRDNCFDPFGCSLHHVEDHLDENVTIHIINQNVNHEQFIKIFQKVHVKDYEICGTNTRIDFSGIQSKDYALNFLDNCVRINGFLFMNIEKSFIFASSSSIYLRDLVFGLSMGEHGKLIFGTNYSIIHFDNISIYDSSSSMSEFLNIENGKVFIDHFYVHSSYFIPSPFVLKGSDAVINCFYVFSSIFNEPVFRIQNSSSVNMNGFYMYNSEISLISSLSDDSYSNIYSLNISNNYGPLFSSLDDSHITLMNSIVQSHQSKMSLFNGTNSELNIITTAFLKCEIFSFSGMCINSTLNIRDSLFDRIVMGNTMFNMEYGSYCINSTKLHNICSNSSILFLSSKSSSEITVFNTSFECFNGTSVQDSYLFDIDHSEFISIDQSTFTKNRALLAIIFSSSLSIRNCFMKSLYQTTDIVTPTNASLISLSECTSAKVVQSSFINCIVPNGIVGSILSQIIINDCTFLNNSYVFKGSITVSDGKMSCSRNIFKGNAAVLNNSGINLIRSSGNIENCDFINETAPQTSGVYVLQCNDIIIRNINVDYCVATLGVLVRTERTEGKVTIENISSSESAYKSLVLDDYDSVEIIEVMFKCKKKCSKGFISQSRDSKILLDSVENRLNEERIQRIQSKVHQRIEKSLKGFIKHEETPKWKHSTMPKPLIDITGFDYIQHIETEPVFNTIITDEERPSNSNELYYYSLIFAALMLLNNILS